MTTHEQITAIMAEQKEWSLRNFGPTTPENINDPLIGIVEELGELARAILKKKQGIRGTPQEHDAAMVDAIGDMQIFLIDAMNRHGFAPSEHEVEFMLQCASDPKATSQPFLVYAYSITSYCSSVEYHKAVPENRQAAMRLMWQTIWALSGSLGIDPLDALFVAWRTTVSKRNWIANPDTGAPPQERMGLPDLVDNSEVLRRAHEDGIIHLTGEHFRILEQISANHKFAEKTCREITQAHYAQLLEGGLV